MAEPAPPAERAIRASALYLNVFVGVVQTFQKVAYFHALAPTQTEPPFAVAQGIVLIAFIALGIAAVKKFRPASPGAAFAWRA